MLTLIIAAYVTSVLLLSLTLSGSIARGDFSNNEQPWNAFVCLVFLILAPLFLLLIIFHKHGYFWDGGYKAFFYDMFSRDGVTMLGDEPTE